MWMHAVLLCIHTASLGVGRGACARGSCVCGAGGDVPVHRAPVQVYGSQLSGVRLWDAGQPCLE